MGWYFFTTNNLKTKSHKIPQNFSTSDNILIDTAFLRQNIFWVGFIFSSGNLLQPTGLLYYQKVTTSLQAYN